MGNNCQCLDKCDEKKASIDELPLVNPDHIYAHEQ